MGNFRLMHVGFLGLLLAVLSAGGCKKDAAVPTDDPNAVANVKLGTSAALGSFLTDSVGNTLYYFTRDVDGVNTCTSAGCNPVWPIFYQAHVKVPAGLKASDFATKATAGGRLQTTYLGWPLYYYAPAVGGVNTREAPGQTTGDAVGGVWFVVNPGYGVLLATKGVEDKGTHAVATKNYLVDVQGRTLYYFAKDNTSPGTQATNCTGGCATAWPALYMSAPKVPSTLKASDFGTLTRDPSSTTGPYGTTTSSREQLTYKGHPLYYFAGDNNTRGHAEGHDLNSAGDLWFVATP